MKFNAEDLTAINTELVTLHDYIRWTFSQFSGSDLYYGHGTDNAWDEAVNLVLSTLHLPSDMADPMMNCRLTTKERQEIVQLVLRRIEERIPVPYLTHEAWFAGLPFYVDERVLIPRSPLAELIEREFSPWLDHFEDSKILDLCTGSACIAIACALAFPESDVDAVDISEGALAVAKINVSKYNLEDRVHLIQSDLFERLDKTYHLIVSNPPYVPLSEYSTLPDEYYHEPALALKAEEEGLEFAKRIIKGAATHLAPKGLLVVEVGNAQEALCEQYPQIPFLWFDFEKGGQGVFALTAEQIHEYLHYL